MNLEEFLNEFKRTANKVEWTNLDGMLRTIINGYNYCPLTYVCHTKERRRVNVFEAEKAGIRLGLSRDDRWLIILASDFSDLDLSKLRTTAHLDLELRSKLEDAI